MARGVYWSQEFGDLTAAQKNFANVGGLQLLVILGAWYIYIYVYIYIPNAEYRQKYRGH